MHTLVLEDDLGTFVCDHYPSILFATFKSYLFVFSPSQGKAITVWGLFFYSIYSPLGPQCLQTRQPWNGGARGSLQDGAAFTVLYI